MINNKKIKELIKNILIGILRIIIVTINAETNMSIDSNKILKLIVIEILFELLLYINSNTWRIFDRVHIIV